MTFEGDPKPARTDGFGLLRLARREARPEIEPSKNRNVRRFVRDPEGAIGADYTRDPTFGWDLLAYCSEYVDAVPVQGQRLTRTALVIFARNDRDGIQEAACMKVAAQGVLAISDFMLNNLDEATATLSKAFETSAKRNCAGCQAGTLRKAAILDRERGYLGIDPRGYPRAYNKCSTAIQLYSDPLTADHDLLGHGLAHSYMTRGMILSFWNQSEAALSDLASAIWKCPSRSRLFVLCIGNTGTALVRSGKEEHLLRGAEIVVGLKKRFARRRKASTDRAMTYWLEGQISTRIGAREVGVAALEDALDDFVGLEAGGNSAAVISDLSKLTIATPARIRDHIHRLDPERTCHCPSWIPGFLQRDLGRLYRLCGSRSADEPALLRAIADLRKSSGCRFPCLI